MKEKWLFPNAVVPVDVETTASLVAEIHRLIGVVGNTALAQASQEPVAWQFMNGSNFRKRRPDDFADLDSDGLPYWKPLYIHPPQRTEQERDEILQAITDPENQPSQFGTVTLDYHYEKIKKIK